LKSKGIMTPLLRIFLLGLLSLTTALLVPCIQATGGTTKSKDPSPAPWGLSGSLPGSRLSLSVPVYRYRVINTYPHDRDGFTQGLVFEDGILYEGTGGYGQSTLRKVELTSGIVLQSRTLPAQLFGEGVTIYGNRVIQLTWKSHIGFVYDKVSLELLREFRFPREGWGITHDGKRLIVSDGTETLYFLDPESFENIGSIQVHDENGPVTQLNELEYIRGEIYANIWRTDRIAIIAPQTGKVVGWIALEGLLTEKDLAVPVDVLNGIAYDAKQKRLYVTGKLWPKLFEIELGAPE
jgi:glutamine cyclotransferase